MKSSQISIGDNGEISQYNDLRDDAKAGSYLLTYEQSTPDLTLQVEAGIFRIGKTTVDFAGGNSPSFTAPSVNPRIDLLVINSSGTLSRIVGVEAASPDVPAYPNDKMTICEVYNRVGQTSVKDTDDSTNGYIQKDVRPFLNSDTFLVRQDGSTIYAADAGTDDAYVITLSPAPSAYTIGMVIQFKANTANTGVATLNVNSLGAKTIKKKHNTNLEDGDIKSGQIVTVVYDGTNWQMQSQTAGTEGGVSMTAGETINGATLAVPCFSETGDLASEEKITQTESDYTSSIYSANWYAQTFTTDSKTNKVSKVSLYLQKIGSPSGNIDISIYATSAGKPTGSPLATKSISASNIPTTVSDFEFEFSSPVSVSESTQYALVASVPSGDSSNYIRWSWKNNTNPYAGGTYVSSSDSGSSWSISSNPDFRFKIFGGWVGTTGRIYKSDASNISRAKFDFFAISNATEGDNIIMQADGVVSGFSGFTRGEKYYVQDTAGTIGLNPGSKNIPVGIATNTTDLLIQKHFGIMTSGEDITTRGASTSDLSVTKNVNVGFKPRYFECDVILDLSVGNNFSYGSNTTGVIVRTVHIKGVISGLSVYFSTSYAKTTVAPNTMATRNPYFTMASANALSGNATYPSHSSEVTSAINISSSVSGDSLTLDSITATDRTLDFNFSSTQGGTNSDVRYGVRNVVVFE